MHVCDLRPKVAIKPVLWLFQSKFIRPKLGYSLNFWRFSTVIHLASKTCSDVDANQKVTGLTSLSQRPTNDSQRYLRHLGDVPWFGSISTLSNFRKPAERHLTVTTACGSPLPGSPTVDDKSFYTMLDATDSEDNHVYTCIRQMLFKLTSARYRTTV